MKKFIFLAQAFLVFSVPALCTMTLIEKAQNSIGTVISFPFASYRNVSSATQEYIKSVCEKLQPGSMPAQVKHMNTLALYFFGSQNIIALPGLNTILVNEEWFKKLPEEQKRFALGRSLVHLNKPVEYTLYKYLLPILASALVKSYSSGQPFPGIPGTKHWYSTDNTPEKSRQLTHWLSDQARSHSAHLLVQYFSRDMEYEADREAAVKLDCTQGGISLLKDLSTFKDNKTLLSNLSSLMPLFDIPAYAFDFYKTSSFSDQATQRMMEDAQEKEEIRSHMDSYNIWVNVEPNQRVFEAEYERLLRQDMHNHTLKFKNIPFGHFFPHYVLNYLKKFTPGRLTNISNRLEHFISHLPLVHYLWSYPRISDRIAALKTIVKQKTEETAQK